jgi:hypothetical protein
LNIESSANKLIVESSEMQALFNELDLLDAFAVKHSGVPGFTWDPVYNTNTGYDASPFWAHGITPRNPLNKLEAQFDRNMPRRIDFIFFILSIRPGYDK